MNGLQRAFAGTPRAVSSPVLKTKIEYTKFIRKDSVIIFRFSIPGVPDSDPSHTNDTSSLDA